MLPLDVCPGRRRRAVIAKSEDLPGMKLLSHESLAENMLIRLDGCFWPALLRRFFLSGRAYGDASMSAAIFLIDPERMFPMNKKSRISLKHMLGVAALVLLIAALASVYMVFREQPVSGSKAITIEVVNSAGQSKTFPVSTDAAYLLQAMEEAEGLTFSGTEGPYGLMISTVNGETADYNADQSYWSFTVNGEYCNYGVSEQPVEDGDAFAIVYTK